MFYYISNENINHKNIALINTNIVDDKNRYDNE